MEIIKVFVGQDGKVVIGCPKCEKKRTGSAAKLIGKHNLRIRCDCETIFGVKLEFREAYRRNTNLVGYVELFDEKRKNETHFENDSSTDYRVHSRVENISVLGIGMSSFESHELEQGNNVKVVFLLDTYSPTAIEKRAVIRSVRGKYIGCEFVENDKYDQKLKKYVIPYLR